MNEHERISRQESRRICRKWNDGWSRNGFDSLLFVEEIGRRVKEEGLEIVGVTTSLATKKQAEALGIPLKSVDEVDYIDVTIDGADEIAPDFSGIKGGGGALLFEKIVAEQSKSVIWIVDESKMVDYLGRFPLPVEVVPYGSEQLFKRFEALGYKPTFRERDGERYLTDSKNYIIDLDVYPIKDPIAFWRKNQRHDRRGRARSLHKHDRYRACRNS